MTLLKAIGAMIVLLALAATAAGDVIWVGSGAGRGVRQEVDVQGVERGELVYLLNGNRASTPLSRVKQLDLDDQPRLTAAEASFASGSWAIAAEQYRQLYEQDRTDWIRRRAAGRLVEAAAAAGRFADAAIGYVALVRLDPAAAVGTEPLLTEAVAQNDARVALEAVTSELTAGSLQPEQERSLVAFRLALANHLGDADAARLALGRLAILLGDGPPQNDAERESRAQIALGQARLSLDGGDAAAAMADINDNAAVFTTTLRRSQALLLLARATEAAAGEDRGKLLDAAYAYMRVVAHFKNANDADPNAVPDALLAAARLHERLGLDEDAVALYEDLARRHADSVAGQEAAKRLESLGEAPAQ